MTVRTKEFHATTQTAAGSDIWLNFSVPEVELPDEKFVVEKLKRHADILYVGKTFSWPFRNYADPSIKIKQIEEGQMTRQNLERAVAKYFKDHDGARIELENLLELFPCSLPDLVAVCDKLESEGKIAEV